MFFVVYYHIQAISIGIPVNQSVLATTLLSFRMPVFFFISGFIAYKALVYWTGSFFMDRLKIRSRQLLIPVFVFYVLWVLFLRQSNPFSYFIMNGFEGFWFTFVLFGFQLSYFLVSLLTHYIGHKTRDLIFNIIAIVLSLAGVGMLITFESNNVWWRSLCLTPYFRYLQFFIFGILCRKYSTFFFRILDKDYFITILMCVFIVCIYLICSSSNIKAEYGIVGNLINDIIVRYTGLLIVVICFYKNRHFFEKVNTITRILILIGKRSLDIYMIHNFLLPNLSCIAHLFQDKYNFVLEFWMLLVLTTLIIAFALMVGGILRNSRFLGICLLGVKPVESNNLKHI